MRLSFYDFILKSTFTKGIQGRRMVNNKTVELGTNTNL